MMSAKLNNQWMTWTFTMVQVTKVQRFFINCCACTFWTLLGLAKRCHKQWKKCWLGVGENSWKVVMHTIKIVKYYILPLLSDFSICLMYWPDHINEYLDTCNNAFQCRKWCRMYGMFFDVNFDCDMSNASQTKSFHACVLRIVLIVNWHPVTNI